MKNITKRMKRFVLSGCCAIPCIVLNVFAYPKATASATVSSSLGAFTAKCTAEYIYESYHYGWNRTWSGVPKTNNIKAIYVTSNYYYPNDHSLRTTGTFSITDYGNLSTTAYKTFNFTCSSSGVVTWW